MRRLAFAVIPFLVACQALLEFDAAPDASDRDAALDATVGDAATSDGGESDSTVDTDAPAALSCLPHYEICEGFEGPTYIPSFPDVDRGPESTLAPTTEKQFLGARSLMVQQPRTSSINVYTSVGRAFFAANERARVDFDLFVEAPVWEAGDAAQALVALRWKHAGQFAGTTLFASPTSSTLSIESVEAEKRYFAGPQLPFGTWFHVTLDMKLSGSFDYWIDGEHGTKTFPAVTLGSAPEITLQVGIITYNPPTPEFRAYFDNIVLDLD